MPAFTTQKSNNSATFALGDSISVAIGTSVGVAIGSNVKFNVGPAATFNLATNILVGASTKLSYNSGMNVDVSNEKKNIGLTSGSTYVSSWQLQTCASVRAQALLNASLSATSKPFAAAGLSLILSLGAAIASMNWFVAIPVAGSDPDGGPAVVESFVTLVIGALIAVLQYYATKPFIALPAVPNYYNKIIADGKGISLQSKTNLAANAEALLPNFASTQLSLTSASAVPNPADPNADPKAELGADDPVINLTAQAWLGGAPSPKSTLNITSTTAL